ncbi:hypothetical protein ANO14919_011190 [Xylariales sp. No.14919]|nr:hypothetical protein ANO14919_011190 [Xylariales sp. No.14919]
MPPRNSDKPKPVLSSNPISSFTRFIKKSSSLTKGDEPSRPSLRTPEADLDARAPVYTREHRYHNPTEADLKNQATALQTALEGAWPRRHRSRYRNARALLVCWADNDSIDASTTAGPCPPPSSRLSPSPRPFESNLESNITPLVRIPSETNAEKSSCIVGKSTRQGPFVPVAYQLSDVLERRYGIQAQVWMIPSLENPSDMLVGKVKQFVEEYGGPDNLLIFWYGGCADFVGALPDQDAPRSDTSVGEIIWYGLRGEPGIPARTITKALGLARADVLMLNDSPFAQHVYTGHISGPGTFELLGSGSTNTGPNAAREASFTRTLALMLDSPFLASRGISVLELHRKLLDMASPSQPGFRASSSADQRESATIVATVKSTARTPTYPIYCQISQTVQLQRDAQRDIVLSRLDTSLVTETDYARTIGEPRIKLDIGLERPYIDVQWWKEWVLRAPADANEVFVKASWN